MASIAHYEMKAKAPISMHPAFPAIVALWFSALLGVGSLVLPTILLERFVETTGIASLVPAAAPPLGITARGLIALAAAIVGAAIGVSIARRVASAHKPRPESRVAKLALGKRGPLRVKEELGGEKLVNGESLPLNRRRALAISEDDRPSDFLYHAPLPGQDPDTPETLIDAAPEPADTVEEPLELCTPADDEPEIEVTAEAEPQPEADEDDAMSERQEFQPASPFKPFGAPEPEPDANEIGRFKNLAGPRGLEPLPFAAPSLARRAPEPEPEPEPEPPVFEDNRIVFEPVPAADAVPEEQADWESAPLEGLGLVQLVQRLGSTIERRREWVACGAAAAAPDPVPAPAEFAPVDFEPAPPEEAAEAMAAYFGSAPQAEPAEPAADSCDEPEADFDQPEAEIETAEVPRPNFLRPLQASDEDDHDEGVPDFSLPLRRPVEAAPAFAAPDNDASGDEAEEAEGEEDSEAGYSSLLGMKNPFAQPKQDAFVRVDEPEADPAMPEPAVVFPGQEQRERFSIPVSVNGSSRLFDPPGKGANQVPAAGAPAPADADAALRAALATLQKMSGAA